MCQQPTPNIQQLEKGAQGMLNIKGVISPVPHTNIQSFNDQEHI